MGAPVLLSCPHCVAPISLEVVPGKPTRECSSCRKRFEVHVPPRFVRARARAAAPVVAKAVEAGAARCKRHPDNAAPGTCARCGDFICEVCATPAGAQALCVPCFERGIQSGELGLARDDFRSPTISLTCGILGVLASFTIVVGGVLGLVAIGTGVSALLDIGRRPGLLGRGRAIAGITLGAVALLASAGMLAWVLLDGPRR